MNILYKEMSVVAAGGAIGSVARLLLSRGVQAFFPYAELPLGIIVCNISGCFLIGVLYGIFELTLLVNPIWRAGLVIGILGGFTTFSSFSIDTVVFLQKGAYHAALMNIFISVMVCLLATLLGIYASVIFIK
ncbi:MAG: fluoride efflux transporter CrcB [Coxiellaceae bacterium]|nr:fluoride efflux transporter CrcB [Coxiellaceae bacterium]